MDCPECQTIMEAEEIKFGWDWYECPGCGLRGEGFANGEKVEVVYEPEEILANGGYHDTTEASTHSTTSRV